jgi:hypothetical protein
MLRLEQTMPSMWWYRYLQGFVVKVDNAYYWLLMYIYCCILGNMFEVWIICLIPTASNNLAYNVSPGDLSIMFMIVMAGYIWSKIYRSPVKMRIFVNDCSSCSSHSFLNPPPACGMLWNSILQCQAGRVYACFIILVCWYQGLDGVWKSSTYMIDWLTLLNSLSVIQIKNIDTF